MANIVRDSFAGPFMRGFAALLGSAYIRLTNRTIRWRRDTRALEAALGKGGPVIFCVWHGRQFMMAKLWPRGVPLWVLGSTSFDGQVALAVARRFGIRTIERHKAALGPLTVRALLRALKSGESIGLTPDGSRGPRMNANPGVIDIARLSGAPIVPAAYSCSRQVVFRSWDRFAVPLPFGRGVYVTGDPIAVPPDAGPEAMEAARAQLERALNELTMAADVEVGREPVQPAPKAVPAEPPVGAEAAAPPAA